MTDNLIEIHFDDLIVRADDGDGRTISGVIVPWERPAIVRRPIPGTEIFKRGALTRSITEATRPIPLYVNHDRDQPVGRLVSSHDDDTGQHAAFRVAATPRGDEALELVREGIWTGFSVAALPVPARTRVTRMADGSNRLFTIEGVVGV